MPRLTNRDYLSNRHFLTQLWERESGSLFAVLPGYAQRDLHDFFAFTTSMDDAEALEHRAEMTAAFPSLPQAAGRALAAVHAQAEGRPHRLLDLHNVQTSRVVHVAGESRTVRIEAVTRADVDIDALRTGLRRLDEDQDSTAL